MANNDANIFVGPIAKVPKWPPKLNNCISSIIIMSVLPPEVISLIGEFMVRGHKERIMFLTQFGRWVNNYYSVTPVRYRINYRVGAVPPNAILHNIILCADEEALVRGPRARMLLQHLRTIKLTRYNHRTQIMGRFEQLKHIEWMPEDEDAEMLEYHADILGVSYIIFALTVLIMIVIAAIIYQIIDIIMHLP
jgi:hypothetical protein